MRCGPTLRPAPGRGAPAGASSSFPPSLHPPRPGLSPCSCPFKTLSPAHCRRAPLPEVPRVRSAPALLFPVVPVRGPSLPSSPELGRPLPDGRHRRDRTSRAEPSPPPWPSPPGPPPVTPARTAPASSPIATVSAVPGPPRWR